MKRLVLALALAALAALCLVGTAAAGSLVVGDTPAPITNDLSSWASLVGIGLPALVALLQRDHWSSAVNAAIFGVACVAASVVYGFIRFKGSFTWAEWESTLLAIVVWGLATYHLYWKQGSRGKSIVQKLRAVPGPPPA